MEQKTNIVNRIEAVGNKAKYDAAIKKLLGDKTILSWIIHDTMEEFKNYPIETIRECIEGNPEIGTRKVFPGYTAEEITGNNTEDLVLGEGKVTYDLLFYVITPEKEKVKIIVNVECQNNYYPGYDLITRAIFYCARMLSSQLGKEFTSTTYNEIKKVVSIWVCIAPPDYAKNTITKYGMEQKRIVGSFAGKARYDLLNAVMICLDADDILDDQKNIIGLLKTLLSGSLSAEEKNQRLTSHFGIETTVEVKEVLNHMCNLSDYIENKGIEKGIEKLVVNALKKGHSISEIAEFIDLPETTVEEIAQKNGYAILV